MGCHSKQALIKDNSVLASLNTTSNQAFHAGRRLGEDVGLTLEAARCVMIYLERY